jgi:hypothetical protein
MTEMVERVARAIKERLAEIEDVYFRDDGSDCTIDGHVDIEDLARAAIEAMREPTQEILDAPAVPNALGDDENYSDIDVREAYQAMIDAALKD